MSHYADFHYADYDETLRCATTERQCEACDDMIPVGHCYWAIDILITEADEDGDGEEREQYTRCLRCQTIHLHLRRLSRDMWPDERLACGEEYEEHWGRKPPEEIAALAFGSAADLQTPELQAQALSKGQYGSP